MQAFPQVAAWVYTEHPVRGGPEGAKRGNARDDYLHQVMYVKHTVRYATGAAVALACVFAGIWITDAALVRAFDLPRAYFTLRLFIVADYALFFALVWVVARRALARGQSKTDPAVQRRRRRFLVASSIVALAISGAAIAWWSWAGPEAARSLGPTATGALILCMKIHSIPVTVVIACLFARIDGDLTTGLSAFGMFGAFLVEAAFGGTHAAFGAVPSAWTGFLLVAVALACAALATHQIDRVGAWYDVGGSESMRASFSPAFVGSIMVAGIMLGYLHGTGDVINSSAGTPLALALLLVLSAVIWRQRSWNERELFLTAVLLTSTGVLLEPLLDSLPGAPCMALATAGSAFFELGMWVLLLRCTRMCVSSMTGAAGSRLLIVVGHTVGAAVAATAIALQAAGVEVQAVSQAIVVVYLLGIIVFARDPNNPLSLAYGGVVEAEDRQAARPAKPAAPAPAGQAPRTESAVEPLPAPQPAPAPTPAAHPAPAPASANAAPPAPNAYDDELLWEAPCRAVAREYGLTPRETDVLAQIARGRMLGEIADAFVLSKNTVKMHTKHIYQKLDVHSKQEAIEIVNEERFRMQQGA